MENKLILEKQLELLLSIQDKVGLKDVNITRQYSDQILKTVEAIEALSPR